MKLKVKKDFKDKKANIIRKKNEIFEVDENRAKELIERGFVEEVIVEEAKTKKEKATVANVAETATAEK